MIKIYTEKVWIGNEQGYKVVRVDALQIYDLPQKYIDSKCIVLKTKTDGCLLIKDHEWHFILQLNSVWNKKDFYIILDHIRKCGDNLKKIKDEWAGKKTFTV